MDLLIFDRQVWKGMLWWGWRILGPVSVHVHFLQWPLSSPPPAPRQTPSDVNPRHSGDFRSF